MPEASEASISKFFSGLLEEILETASAAASNFNSQPWQIHLLTGEAKLALSDAILKAYAANTIAPFSPFPQPMPPRYGVRVDDFGRRYYSALGIDRSDAEARARQACARVARTDFLFIRASALELLAKTLDARDRKDEASAALDEAHRTLVAKGILFAAPR